MRPDRKSLLRISTVLVAVMVCVGCGQKGPLRLSEPAPAQDDVATPAQAAPSADPTTLSARLSNPHE